MNRERKRGDKCDERRKQRGKGDRGRKKGRMARGGKVN